MSIYARPCCPPGSRYGFAADPGLCDSCPTPTACLVDYQEIRMPTPNPKVQRAVVDGKAPLDYLEPVCDDGEARVMYGGAEKYGRRNYRDTEMLWTTYLGSMRRHLNALARGEDCDPESGELHLSHIRANTAVLQGAMEAGTLRDDRLDKVSTPLSDRVHIDGDQDAKAEKFWVAAPECGPDCCTTPCGSVV